MNRPGRGDVCGGLTRVAFVSVVRRASDLVETEFRNHLPQLILDLILLRRPLVGQDLDCREDLFRIGFLVAVSVLDGTLKRFGVFPEFMGKSVDVRIELVSFKAGRTG